MDEVHSEWDGQDMVWYQQEGVLPDIITIAKGIASGFHGQSLPVRV